jgi:hypothetical protein
MSINIELNEYNSTSSLEEKIYLSNKKPSTNHDIIKEHENTPYNAILSSSIALISVSQVLNYFYKTNEKTGDVVPAFSISIGVIGIAGLVGYFYLKRKVSKSMKSFN